MKKITLVLSLLSFGISQAQIIVKDIPDFTLSNGTSLDFDFNSDGTAEFTFESFQGTIETFFDFTKVNFVGAGTLASGYGWDIMKSLPVNTVIGSSSVFDAQGDAYINAPWGNGTDIFPAGDSYVGTRFKLGNNTYYGWILVNSTGGATGVIKIKSYAYNSTANATIKTGQTTLSNSEFKKDFEVSVFPNPASTTITLETDKIIKTATAYTIAGRNLNLQVSSNNINVSHLAPGIYFLNILTATNEQSNIKFIKK